MTSIGCILTLIAAVVGVIVGMIVAAIAMWWEIAKGVMR